MRIFITASFFLLVSYSHGQTPAKRDSAQKEKLVQVSGIVADAQSMAAMPFVVVKIKNKNIYTNSAINGFFSIVAGLNDTLQFSYIGYKRKAYVVPDTIHAIRTSVFIPMEIDTQQLSEVEIYPWPSREDFKEAFLSLKIDEDIVQVNPMAFAGIRRIDNPIPVEPTIFNPITLFYEGVIKRIKERTPKNVDPPMYDE